jgi:HEPN domain-containing protein
MQAKHRGGDWLRQAQGDLRLAKAAVREGFYAQTCFICQQASEKALKAILYSQGAKAILTHSLHKLCQELEMGAELEMAARILDQYYLSARYPDALAEGAPDDVFTSEQAETSVRYAERFVERAGELVR